MVENFEDRTSHEGQGLQEQAEDQAKPDSLPEESAALLEIARAETLADEGVDDDESSHSQGERGEGEHSAVGRGSGRCVPEPGENPGVDELHGRVGGHLGHGGKGQGEEFGKRTLGCVGHGSEKFTRGAEKAGHKPFQKKKAYDPLFHAAVA